MKKVISVTNLIYDRLHMWLVRLISIQQRRPLIRCNAQSTFHSNLNNLRVVFTSQSLVSTELLFQLHQGWIFITFGNLDSHRKKIYFPPSDRFQSTKLKLHTCQSTVCFVFLQESLHLLKWGWIKSISLTGAGQNDLIFLTWKFRKFLLFTRKTYLEARGPVKELYYMSYASFRSLREAWLKPLDHKENQHFPGQSRTIF